MRSPEELIKPAIKVCQFMAPFYGTSREVVWYFAGPGKRVQPSLRGNGLRHS
ncbi:hypothetical protein BX257_9211 [Streptomyces sp. 3212.3]|nr:hypothetical protein BX257_9211 [Streptomyces sp. 3212.3]